MNINFKNILKLGGNNREGIDAEIVKKRMRIRNIFCITFESKYC